MFVDTAKVFISAGLGGKGALNFRREKYIDKGGPDGGDGGKGGDVVFVGDSNTNTLVSFRYNPELKAEHGQAGTERNKHGKNGSDLLVKVPIGTLVRRNDELLADIVENGQKIIIAHGGDGGYGNAHFKSSTRQAPRIAELGEQGESFEARLELKLLADVGLVGFPNAGKSTLLSVISNARPEIADYAFTTLTPNLGVADIDDSSLLVADIPGLIEGAAEGKGLGVAFLRHVERTPLLLHLIDVYTEDVAASYKVIRHELAAYSQDLAGRPEVVALTKIEGMDKEILADQMKKLQAVLPPETALFAISAAAGKGLKEILRELSKQIKLLKAKTQKPETPHPTIPTISLSPQAVKQAWKVEKKNKIFMVRGNKIEKFTERTDFNNPHAIARLRDIMRKMGIVHELERQGATSESVIKIGLSQFSLAEQ